jgi:hypothetical protein
MNVPRKLAARAAGPLTYADVMNDELVKTTLACAGTLFILRCDEPGELASDMVV